MKTFISFDLETTGTLSHIDEIVEIGAIYIEEGEVKARFNHLISIDRPMPPEASRVNGITDEMLKGKPRIEELLPDFAEFCGDHLIVAHNAPFDFQFLLRAIQEHRTAAPRGYVLDTCQLARKTFPGLLNYKLATCCEFLKIKGNAFHRADSDAFYCSQLFLGILEKTSFSSQQVKELAHLAGRSPLRFPKNHLDLQLDMFE